MPVGVYGVILLNCWTSVSAYPLSPLHLCSDKMSQINTNTSNTINTMSAANAFTMPLRGQTIKTGTGSWASGAPFGSNNGKGMCKTRARKS